MYITTIFFIFDNLVCVSSLTTVRMYNCGWQCPFLKCKIQNLIKN